MPHNQKLAVSPVLSFLKVVNIVVDYNDQQNPRDERQPDAVEPLSFEAQLIAD